ncbi:hypothetical protein ANN_14906 [Periplaneta americana]|uniref:Uncharacterized protein n=1 Tax=Periplaneta americana TaxID=6978 RepID=A0ABQ8SZ44_PERAM|nr:hypothetical protein ANN_14906 [Periplaneta americana]
MTSLCEGGNEPPGSLKAITHKEAKIDQPTADLKAKCRSRGGRSSNQNGVNEKKKKKKKKKNEEEEEESME